MSVNRHTDVVETGTQTWWNQRGTHVVAERVVVNPCASEPDMIACLRFVGGSLDGTDQIIIHLLLVGIHLPPKQKKGIAEVPRCLCECRKRYCQGCGECLGAWVCMFAITPHPYPLSPRRDVAGSWCEKEFVLRKGKQ